MWGHLGPSIAQVWAPGWQACLGPSGQGRGARPRATRGRSCPVSTSAIASPAPEKTGSAQSPQEACVRSLPTPGPLQNANSPITTGTTQWRAETLWPPGLLKNWTERLQPSLAWARPQGECPAVASRSPRSPRVHASRLTLDSQPSPGPAYARPALAIIQSEYGVRGHREAIHLTWRLVLEDSGPGLQTLTGPDPQASLRQLA